MLESESQPPSEISVLIATAEEMRRLNREFRGLDRPTDVLSFPAGDCPEPWERRPLGDIAVCLPLAERQARERSVPVATELACLAVHGGLHLLGYDDGSEPGRREMVEKMNAALAAAGLKPADDWSSPPVA